MDVNFPSRHYFVTTHASHKCELLWQKKMGLFNYSIPPGQPLTNLSEIFLLQGWTALCNMLSKHEPWPIKKHLAFAIYFQYGVHTLFHKAPSSQDCYFTTSTASI